MWSSEEGPGGVGEGGVYEAAAGDFEGLTPAASRSGRWGLGFRPASLGRPTPALPRSPAGSGCEELLDALEGDAEDVGDIASAESPPGKIYDDLGRQLGCFGLCDPHGVALRFSLYGFGDERRFQVDRG